MDSLYTAQSGLFTSRYAIEVTSNNIANENTDGYKKRVSLSSELDTLESSVGNGVSFDGVDRITNQYLFNQLLSQSSTQSYYETEDSTLSQIEIYFQETDDSGFSIVLSDYFESIENLRSSPSNETYKAALESQGELLVSSIQELYTDLEELENSLSSQLEDEVDEVNKILEEIAYLNEQIQNNSDTRNDLLDKRDQLEMELASYVDIEVDSSDDNYNLKIAGVSTIFNGTNVHEVSIVEDADGNNSLTVYNNELNLSSGSLKSLSENLQEGSNLFEIQDSLDSFANALITETNTTVSTALFDGDSVSNIEFNTDAIDSLSSDELEDLAQIQWGDEYVIGDETTSFSDYYSNLRISISSNVEDNAFKLEAQETVVQSLTTTFNNETKVDSDEEMINLIEYQAAYEANAKVITVVDEMLQTLLDM